MRTTLQIRPRLAFKLLGTGLQLDTDKVYDAVVARNLPDWLERKAIFVEELILEDGEYEIVKGKFPAK